MKVPRRSLNPVEFTLTNGLRVVLVENRRLPTVAVNLTVLAGAGNETEETAGLAALVSRLLDEGTESRSSLEIADTIESVGGAIECDASHDLTTVLLAVLAKDLDLGLELVADIVVSPTFHEDSLSNERERTLAEIRSAMDRPQVVAGWAFDELVYDRHSLHRPVHGYPATIEKIVRTDLETFHRRFFVPGNAILSMVGDFSADQAVLQLETAFRRWKGLPAEVEKEETPVPQSEIRCQRIEIPSQQAHVYFGHLGIERNHPDFYALQVMDAILGGGAGLTSRLPRKLRDEQGLAYTTFASITSTAGLAPGKFAAYIGTAPENVERSIEGFVHEIDRIRAELVDQEELDDAKSYLTGSFVFGFESNSQVARFLANAQILGLGYDYVEQYPTYIETITTEEIRRVASRHLSTERYSLVIAGPADSRHGGDGPLDLDQG